MAVKEITDRVRDVKFDMITVRLDKRYVKREKAGNVTVYRIGWGLGRIDKLLFPFRAARLAGKLHQQNHYDIVWSIMASWSGFAALFFKKKNPQVKFLLTLQEGDDLRVPVKKSFLVHFWFKQIFTRADYIQCISNYLAKWAKKMGATCPVEVVPNGTNFQFSIFQPKADPPRADNFQSISNDSISNFKKQLDITDDEKIILTTSRLVKKNGIEDLVDAIHLLVTRHSSLFTLVICGDGEEREKLKVKSKKLGIADKVKFVGFVQPEELPKYYAIADVFCRPSLSEGLGNSFLEAMSAGVPVVATPVGGIPDFLQDGVTGWFCKVKDPTSIAEKIKYVMDEKNKEEVKKVTADALKMVQEKYNWSIIAGQMNNIFNKLL